MLDFIMLAVLGVSFALVGLLVHWCSKRDVAHECKEICALLILGGIVLLMGVYLVYALVHPEKF